MANIIIPKYKDVAVESKMLIKGKWKIEIVHPNGEVSKPLGDEMRPNLIMDRGLRMLCGHAPSTWSGDGGTTVPLFRGIADVISTALYSEISSNPTLTNFRGDGVGSVNGGWTNRNTTNDCTQVANLAGDGVVIKKVWDFNAVQTGTHTVREICIGNKYSSSANAGLETATSGYGKPSNFAIFSRFILPSNITLDTYQFLRLTYTLEVSIPATVTPIDVPNITSGGFSALGKMKLLGSFSQIFGVMASTGYQNNNQYYNYGGGDSTYRKYWPWALLGMNTNTYAGAALMSASDQNGTDALSIEDYAPNTVIPNSILNTKSLTRLIVHNGSFGDVGCSIDTETYTAGSNSCSKSANILFPATVPNSSAWVGGVFFTPVTHQINTNAPIRPELNSLFVLGLDGNGRGLNHGWLYNFYDELGNRRAQFKDINFALRFSYIQTVTR